MASPESGLVATPRYRAVLEGAVTEARRRGHSYVGVEHLMLAILDEGESVPAVALRHRGLALPALYDDLAALVEAAQVERSG